MKKKPSKKKPGKTAKPAPPTSPAEKEDTGFDFGGLPPRDLKKNLGCG